MNMPPWTAEHAVTEEEAARLVGGQFGDLEPVQIRTLGVGWDNTAFEVNGEWVFRFPRRQIAVDLLRTESRLLPALARRLPLPVPVPERLGRPSEAFPWPFAGYRRLAGETACRAGLDEAQRTAAAEPLARFLAALHAVDAVEARRLDAPGDTLGRADVGKRVAMTREQLRKLVEKGLLDDDAAWTEIVDEAPADFVPGDSTLVHGDLYARHLLVDPEGRPSGVIDWGDLHFGEVAVDLGIVFAFLPPAARERFFAVYGQVDAERLAVARLRAVFSSATILGYGHEVSDAALVREGREALRLAAS